MAEKHQIQTLEDLFIVQLKDLYDAENQLVEVLPKFIKKTTNSKLKAGFEKHLQETKQQVERLDKIGDLLGQDLKGKECAGMKGIIQEAEELLGEIGSPGARDAALICAQQHVEHYEISGYGSVRTFAEALGNKEVCELLQRTLDEEGATDKKLSQLSEIINERAKAA